MMPAAFAIADVLSASAPPNAKVLDLAAGHGMFGIVVAQKMPGAKIVAVDWAPVLAVAKENARTFGVQDRHEALAGDAFKVDFGTDFDVALVTNFLHHFDQSTCTSFLKKVGASLKPGGRVVVLEFVPNPDRVSPPIPASFSLTMLAGTPAGDAYTLAELQKQLEDAGFKNVSSHALPTPQMVIVGQKA
jgi:ubiquinone/menaquinone biosynthesis C-methylase UbiE